MTAAGAPPGAPAAAPAAGPSGPQQSARRRIAARTRLDFVLDAVVFVSFLVAYSIGFTGLAVHEWLGIVLGLVLVIHLTLHFDWVVRTTRKLLGRGGRDRVIWLVNVALLVCMTLCISSGVLISQVALPELGLPAGGSGFWRGIHGTTATLTLLLVAVHVALRWRWIISVGRRLMPVRPGRRPR